MVVILLLEQAVEEALKRAKCRASQVSAEALEHDCVSKAAEICSSSTEVDNKGLDKLLGIFKGARAQAQGLPDDQRRERAAQAAIQVFLVTHLCYDSSD